MHKSRPYTNETFTKRVDHEAGRHRGVRAPRGPAVCPACRSAYLNRRWVGGKDPRAILARQQPGVRALLCAACRMTADGEWRGELRLAGTFLAQHRAEVERLIRNEAKRAAEDNPLARIVRQDWSAGRLTVLTTTEHLAKRLGRGLVKAYDGKARYRFGHENKTAYVTWMRV